MEKKRFKKSRYDILVDIICIMQLVGIVIYLIVVWDSLPDQIPAHYNAAGVVTRWGGKGSLVFVPIVAWILYLVIIGVERFPQSWNTGAKVTEENKARAYPILINMFSTIKLIMVTSLMFITYNSSLAKALPVWFLPVSMILLFGPSIFFGAKLNRVQKEHATEGGFASPLFVPKRYGVGWTFNFSNPLTWIILIVILGISIFLPLASYLGIFR